MPLVTFAKYRLTSCMSLLLARGSVVDFQGRQSPTTSTSTSTRLTTQDSSLSTDQEDSTMSLAAVSLSIHDKPLSAIVNAANPTCLGGGGVDGAITDAGGPNLANDRLKLPIQTVDGQPGVRCPTGSAVITGPNDYGDIQTPYVIHAVGPNFWDLDGDDEDAIKEGRRLLRSAYTRSLDLATENGINQVAFSLLSSGVYRARLSLEDVLGEAVGAIQEWAVDAASKDKEKKHEDDDQMEVTLCAFNERESSVLQSICDDRL